MADHANSTPAPNAAHLPESPLPAGASPDWTRLWDSCRLTHPRIADTVAAAYAAGVNPRELTLLKLHSQGDAPMPQLWFGRRWGETAVIIGPEGVVS